MIVILCDSFEFVKECFAFFMDYLEKCEPNSITKVYEYSYGLETSEHIRYIFVDHRMEHLFDSMKPNYIDQASFFEGIDMGYFNNWR